MPGEHSSKQYDTDLETIRSKVLTMGGLVESQFQDAIACFRTGNVPQAEQIIKADESVNNLEVSLDDACSHLIVKRQPTANDLRTVMATIKVITDLERIGDEATKIARRAIQLCEEGEAPRGYVEVRHIGDQVRNMVRDALDAFARFDAELALSVAQYDKIIDREYKTALRELATYMMEDPRSISRVLSIIWVLRSLERIGDHARNISELVIYLVRGTDVRHMGLKRMKAEVEGSADLIPNVPGESDDK